MKFQALEAKNILFITPRLLFYEYAQTLIVVNLIVVKIFGFSFITDLIWVFGGEPRVVSDTVGYGGADSDHVRPLEVKKPN